MLPAIYGRARAVEPAQVGAGSHTAAPIPDPRRSDAPTHKTPHRPRGPHGCQNDHNPFGIWVEVTCVDELETAGYSACRCWSKARPAAAGARVVHKICPYLKKKPRWSGAEGASNRGNIPTILEGELEIL